MWDAWTRKRTVPAQKILKQSSKEEQCNSCHLSMCKILVVWVFVLTWEEFVFRFVGLSVKLLISISSVIGKKSKPLLICLGQHYFFHINALTPKPALSRRKSRIGHLMYTHAPCPTTHPYIMSKHLKGFFRQRKDLKVFVSRCQASARSTQCATEPRSHPVQGMLGHPRGDALALTLLWAPQRGLAPTPELGLPTSQPYNQTQNNRRL